MKRRLILSLLSLILSTQLFYSCSTGHFNSTSNKDFVEYIRLPANSTDEISYYLAIDKLKYYINEFSIALEDKIPHQTVQALRAVKTEELMALKLDLSDIKDAKNYDKIIYNYLAAKNLLYGAKAEDLTWNYNFFKNKLNEAFILTPSKLNLTLDITGQENALAKESLVDQVLYDVDEMTLDSGHYISNRTTRAIFWEAIDNQRTIEFHLGDSREFLKTLASQDGKILYEVRPLAKNYNKIFIVQYPGEANYRYAITNIGGQDRLNHLTHQLNLSQLSGQQVKSKVVIKGNLKRFHDARTEEHIQQLLSLPHANRTIIGQKESIDGKFNIFWKMNALLKLHQEEPALFQNIDSKLLTSFLKLEKLSLEVIFKDKKHVEDLYVHFEDYFQKNPSKLPPKFKIFNYDNFTIEMCDYVFQNNSGKNIRWRVISNVWGDEIIPIARALKATNHTNITYMGTAGAFAHKGYKVGDLVIPSAVVDHDKKIEVKAHVLKIDGAKYGGAVEHVGSPFEETKNWLAKTSARSEFVEVETSYLREIFKDSSDNLEIYLLISDILGSETETLANATSAKRKNAQNKLLAELFKRDTGHIPTSITPLAESDDVAIKELIEKVLIKKDDAYRYLIFSLLKGKKGITEEIILDLADKTPAFTDGYVIGKLVSVGEVINDIKSYSGIDFDIGFNKTLVEGTWNAKADKIQIQLIPKNQTDLGILKKYIENNQSKYHNIIKHAKLIPQIEFVDENLVRSKLPPKVDPDILVKIYSYAGLENEGLYRSVSYNGNLSFNTLPTTKFDLPEHIFIGPNGKGFNSSSTISHSECIDLIEKFLMTL